MALRPGTKICKHDDTRGWFSIVGRSKSGMRGNRLQEERRDEDGGGVFFPQQDLAIWISCQNIGGPFGLSVG